MPVAPSRLFVKICCITSAAEARLALAAGADCLGFVSRMPNGPGMIAESTIAELVATLPPAASACLLTSTTDPAAVLAQVERIRPDRVQLCAPLPTDSLAALRQHLPARVKLLATIHITGPEAVHLARDTAPHVDALLLDSGNPARTPCCPVTLGGTGRTHDWTLSRQIVALSPVPVLLAGGLTPDNVAQAVRTVQPAGVDVCSGIRTDDQLDSAKLHAFFSSLSPFRSPPDASPVSNATASTRADAL